MAQEVHELISVAGCQQLLSIKDPAICTLTFEVLASFEFDQSHTNFNREDTIQFYAFEQHHSMSLTQFSVSLRLYDDDFIHTEEHTQLPNDYPLGVTLQHLYRILFGDDQYEPGISKALCLIPPSHKYIHTIPSRSVNGHGDSIGVLRQLELVYLYFMVQSPSTQGILWPSICDIKVSIPGLECYFLNRTSLNSSMEQD